MDIVQELRNKKSRDNRDLLDRAAEEIEKLRKEVEASRNTNNAKKVVVPTVLGKLVAEPGGDPDYPEVFIYLEREDGTQVDLVMAGQIDPDGANIRACLYADTTSDDYTESFTWSKEALLIE